MKLYCMKENTLHSMRISCFSLMRMRSFSLAISEAFIVCEHDFFSVGSVETIHLLQGPSSCSFNVIFLL
jgi:hypothetical protein